MKRRIFKGLMSLAVALCLAAAGVPVATVHADDRIEIKEVRMTTNWIDVLQYGHEAKNLEYTVVSTSPAAAAETLQIDDQEWYHDEGSDWVGMYPGDTFQYGDYRQDLRLRSNSEKYKITENTRLIVDNYTCPPLLDVLETPSFSDRYFRSFEYSISGSNNVLEFTGPVALYGLKIGQPVTYDFSKLVKGGYPPHTYSAEGLPDGLSIDPSTGVISGMPTELCDDGTSIITVKDNVPGSEGLYLQKSMEIYHYAVVYGGTPKPMQEARFTSNMKSVLLYGMPVVNPTFTPVSTIPTNDQSRIRMVYSGDTSYIEWQKKDNDGEWKRVEEGTTFTAGTYQYVCQFRTSSYQSKLTTDTKIYVDDVKWQIAPEDEVTIWGTDQAIYVISPEYTISDPVPLSGDVEITGFPRYGKTLYANTRNLSGYANYKTLRYTWYRDDVEISGETRSTHKLVEEDIGKTIKVKVTSVDTTGEKTASTSEKVRKADAPDAPQGLTGHAPDAPGASTGSIDTLGIAGLEYSTNREFTDARDVTGSGVYHLPAGTYYIRYKETKTRYASDYTSVIVPHVYQLTFDKNDGSGETKSEQVTEGKPYSLPKSKFEAPEGKEFYAWEINGSKYRPDMTLWFDSDTVLKSIWKEKVSITGITITPAGSILSPSSGTSFSADVSGTGEYYDHRVTWSVSNNRSTGTKISENGFLWVASDEPISENESQYLKVTATSKGNPSISKTVRVKIEERSEITGITLSTPAVTLKKGDSVELTAEVLGRGNYNKNVYWEFGGGDLYPTSSGTTLTRHGSNDTQCTLKIGADETRKQLRVIAKSSDGSKSTAAEVYIVDDTAPTLSATLDVSGEAKVGKTLTPEITDLVPETERDNLIIYWIRDDGATSTVNYSSIANPGGAITLSGQDCGHKIKYRIHSPNTLGYVESAEYGPVAKGDQNAPTGLTGVAPTTTGGMDGKITGTSAFMEFSTDPEFSTAASCKTDETTDLSPGTYYVRYYATDNANASPYAKVVVPDVPGAVEVSRVTITPTSVSLKKGGTQTFTAEVFGSGELNTAVNWSVTGNSDTNTTIDTNGKLVIGPDENDGTLTVTARSQQDPEKSASATVTVYSDPVINLTEASIKVAAPSIGAAPATAATVLSGDGVSVASISWSPENNPFAAGRAYTVTLTLESDDTHQFTDATEFRINGQPAILISPSAPFTAQEAKISYTFAAMEPPHTHTLVHHERKEPTCTEDGNIEYWECSGCHSVFKNAVGTVKISKSSTVLPAAHKFAEEWSKDDENHWHECTACGAKKDKAAHSYGALVVDTPATETTEGSGHRICGVCGYQMTETIPALDHTHSLTHHAAVAPTCTTAGSIEYWECASCHKLFSDAAGSTEILDIVDPALGHDFASTWSTDSMKHWHVCSRCGAKADEGYHLFGSWVIDTPATSTTPGKKHKVCEACGHVETSTIPVLHIHALTHHKAVYATCTANGTIEYWECSICSLLFATPAATPESEVLPADLVDPALGHDFTGAWKSNGTGHWHACSRCDAKGDFAAHTFGSWTHTGSHTHECTVCKYTETEECTFGEWKVTKQPTATEKGAKERTCTKCGYVEKAEIPATGTTKPDSSNPSKPDSGSPRTGDRSQTALWIVLMLCAAGASATMIRRRRDER